MSSSVLFGKCAHRLPLEYVCNVFSRSKQMNISYVPPPEPSGNEIYLYNKGYMKDRYLHDGNDWSYSHLVEKAEENILIISYISQKNIESDVKVQLYVYCALTGACPYLLVHYYVENPTMPCAKSSTILMQMQDDNMYDEQTYIELEEMLSGEQVPECLFYILLIPES